MKQKNKWLLRTTVENHQFCFSSIEYMLQTKLCSDEIKQNFWNKFYTLECVHIYRNWIYPQNINMDSVPELQLLMPLKLFIPFLIVLLVFMLVQ